MIPPSILQRSRYSGAALIVVLALVVVLMGLILAFFSKSILAKQASAASANQAKVAIFSKGAENTVVGDLIQEISAGSTVVSGTDVLAPSTPQRMVLSLAGATPQKGNENLVKTSRYSVPFFSGAGFSPGAGPSRASSSSSSSKSLNGRSVTGSRWNRPLLMAAKSTSDYTPSVNFTVPDWVLVARDGGNPQAWSDSLKVSDKDTGMVVGRYAYAIYDVGGLLDANVAGSPDSTGLTGSDAAHPYYKGSSAFADLTKLTAPDGNSLLSQSSVDQLVAWRNGASSVVSGTIPSVAWTNPAKISYFKYVFANATGFLTTGNKSLVNGASDRQFTSRQSMIGFFKQVLGGSQNVQDALQYFTVFSRALDQPSYAPSATRPKALSSSLGGNDAVGKDDVINPSFLSIRVPGSNPSTQSFSRVDGSPAYETEPLIKKRFLLRRLGWVTYKGPSSSRNTSDADIASMVNAGIDSTFLSKGTAASIQSYFGLNWSGSGWTYVGKGAGGAIAKLSEVAAQKREPDFVELLQAAIHVGSIAKASTAAPYLGSQDFARDTSTNLAIMQIAANIIDQFDADGYPTRIAFGGVDTFGIENLPFVYRLHPGAIMLRNATPAVNVTSGVSASDFKDTGVGMYLLLPEMWNPHDRNCPLGNPRPTQFKVYAEFAESTYMTSNGNSPSTSSSGASPDQYFRPTATATAPFSRAINAGSPDGMRGSLGGYNRPQFSESNTALTFEVPNVTVFREPTMLVVPGKPAGSNLAFAGSTLSNLDPELTAITRDTAGTLAFSGGGFQNIVKNPFTLQASQNSPGTSFLGIIGGIFPLRWQTTDAGSPNPNNLYTFPSQWGAAHQTMYFAPMKMYAGYQDESGKWVTYDAKQMPLTDSYLRLPQNPDTDAGGIIDGISKVSYTFDPRTARFGSPHTSHINRVSLYPAPCPELYRNGSTGGWLDSANAVLTTDRPGAAGGFGPPSKPHSDIWGGISGLPAIGWHLGPPMGVPDKQAEAAWPRPGFFTQNNPAIKLDGKKIDSDPNFDPTICAQFYSDPDGVVRRAMGGWASGSDTTGLPMATASLTNNFQSRPWILNRPFRSVAELGYCFSGAPWKNLSFSTQESGFSALLDIFTVTETQDPAGLVAGKTNLNTRQSQVIKAIIAGSYRDEFTPSSGPIDGNAADTLANALVSRTSSTDSSKGPLINISDLVGRWDSKTQITGSFTPALDSNHNVDGSTSYSGFSGDLSSGLPTSTDKNIGRFREATIRALSSSGQTRVWNVMIDLVAQTGRYPLKAQGLDDFQVEGERRVWVHLAIDRFTGKVLDRQTEVVTE